jgi:hypothetical protein
MLEIIAGIIVVLSCLIVAALVVSGLAIFIGTINGIDSDAFNDED